MKYAIFSDIHSNLEALVAVLEDMYEQGVTHTVCLGDVVGYNASPRECLTLVRTLDCPVMMGNHDEMVAGVRGNPAHFNALASEGITHSKKNLSNEDRQFLANRPMYMNLEGFTVVHASMDDPENWNYVTSALEASNSMVYQKTGVCFCGHTHVPKIFIKDVGQVKELPPTLRMEFQKNKHYLINVGAVGQPRDRDWRASYVIYNLEDQTLEFRRVSYDLEKSQKKILAAGLPEPLAARLAMGA